MVVNIDEEKLYEYNFEQQLEVLEDIAEDPEETDAIEVLDKVREGIYMKFPLNYYLEGDYKEMPSGGIVRIAGRMEGDLQVFRNEIRNRKKMIRNAIRRYLQINEKIGTNLEPINFENE